MDDKEKEVQRALGTLSNYYVVLRVVSRDSGWSTWSAYVEAANEDDAFREAIQHCLAANGTVRRDQIQLHNLYEVNS